MKVAIKYGLLITIGVVAWLIIAHTLVPDPNAKIHNLGAAVVFNVLEAGGIYLGIRDKQRSEANVLGFKTGVKTGIAIAFVYGILVSAFFCLVVLFAPQWMPSQQGAGPQQSGGNIAAAFLGLFIGAMLMGLIYATISSFLIVRAQKGRVYS